MGRLPLPALPRRRQGRTALEIGRGPHPLLSRTGRSRAEAEGDRFRARWRNRGAARQGIFVRRSATAHSSRREPGEETGTGNAGTVYRLRSVGNYERQQARRLSAARTLRRKGIVARCRFHLCDQAAGKAGADREAGAVDRKTRIYRQCARRPKPLVDRTLGAVVSSKTETRGRGRLRSFQW